VSSFGTRRWLALGALALAGLCVGIDATVLNLALPTLATALHASTAELQWFVAAYSLVLAAAMIPGGMLGDRFGRKKFLLIALVIFGAASLACAYAPSSGALIGARAALGLAAAFVTPLTLSVLPVLFSEKERGSAVTVIVSMTMVALPLGPILGGWLLTHYWWGSVFLINVPVVVLALIAVALLLPESRSEKPQRLDPIGILTSSVGLAVTTYGVIEAGQNGWGNSTALACMVSGALVLAVFVFWERRVRHPLVDLTLFRSPSFTWGTILLTMVSFAMFGLMFSAPQFFQAILGADAFGSGLRLLPLIGGLILGAVAADRLLAGAGAKVAVALGFLVLAAGLLLGSLTHVSSSGAMAGLWIAVTGAGLGLAMPKCMDAALSALSPERSGVGSALLQAVRMVGGSFGAAILGSILNSAYHGGLDLGGVPPAGAAAAHQSVFAGLAWAAQNRALALLEAVRVAFVHGMDVMLLVCVGIALAGLVLTLVFLPGRSSVMEPRQVEAAAAAEAERLGGELSA
jgi:DHA2 family multidrug resistance protein-like MFS transporter